MKKLTDVQIALMNAMDTQTPFSWIKNHKVQAGVYLVWSQEYFQEYER